eukprot:scaffold2897_cov178-Amphora_coffeaeformis.AAC.5
MSLYNRLCYLYLSNDNVTVCNKRFTVFPYQCHQALAGSCFFWAWRFTKSIKYRRHPLMKVSIFRISGSDATYSNHGSATWDICNNRTNRIPYKNKARPEITASSKQIEGTTKATIGLVTPMRCPNHCQHFKAL